MKTEKLNMRISKDLKEKLKELADNDNRSLSNYVLLQLQILTGGKKGKTTSK